MLRRRNFPWSLIICACLFLPSISSGERLFPDVPQVDMIAFGPFWPGETGGPKVFCLHYLTNVNSDGKYLYVCDNLNNRLLIWDMEDLEGDPVAVLGQPDFHSNLPREERAGFRDGVFSVFSDGQRLFVGARGKIMIYDEIPTRNFAEPDLVIGDPAVLRDPSQADVVFPMDVPADVWYDGRWLYFINGGPEKSVYILTHIPSKGEKIEVKDIVRLGDGEGCSATRMMSPKGIAVDEEYVYVADEFNRRVLVWRKDKLTPGVPPSQLPADFVIGWKDFENKVPVEDPAGRIFGNKCTDVAVDGRYIYVGDCMGRVLVFDKSKLSNGMLASYVVGRPSLDANFGAQIVTPNTLSYPDGVFSDGKHLFVIDISHYNPSVLIFDLRKLKSGMAADRIVGGIFAVGHPGYGLDIAGGKMFVAFGEGVGVFNSIPTSNYQYPDWYLGGRWGAEGVTGGVDVSCDGEHLCIIEKGGTVHIYNEIPEEPRPPDVTIKNIGPYGIIAGGAASGISCGGGHLAAVSSDINHSMVLVWKEIPTHDDQVPDVVLTEAAGVQIRQPFDVFIYGDTLFVADSEEDNRILVYYDIPGLTNDSEPDLILTPLNDRGEPMFRSAHYVFYDGRNLFVTDLYCVHIYHGLPSDGTSPPDEVICCASNGREVIPLSPWGVRYDGNYLWLINIWRDTGVWRIPRLGVEPLPPPEERIKPEFAEYLETGVVPDFLSEFIWGGMPPSEQGKAIEPVCLDSVPEVERTYEQALSGRFGGGGGESRDFRSMVEAGVSWKRFGVNLTEVDWELLDNQVMAAQKAGMVLHLVLDMPSESPLSAEEFGRTAALIAERYDMDGMDDMPGLRFPVEHFEVMNEVRLEEFPDYGRYYSAAYRALKEANPRCKVAPSSFVGPDARFLSFLKSEEVPFDYLSYHSYADYLEVDELFALLDSLGLGRPEIWLTESQFGGMKEKLRRTEEEVAEAMVKSYVYALAKGMAKVSPSEWEAHPWFPEGLAWSCLLDEKGRKRPSFRAYKVLAEKLDRFQEAEVEQEGSFFRARFAVRGRTVEVVWGEGKVQVKAGTKLTDVYGDTSYAKADTVMDLGGRLLYLEHLPSLAVDEPEAPVPEDFALCPNFPNPFNLSTCIRYELPRVCRVRIAIYDLRGRTVAVLLDREQEAGFRSSIWDGRDASGREVGSGVYICRMEVEVEGRRMSVGARKLVLVR